MDAFTYRIEQKCKSHDFSLVNLSDFQIIEDGTVDAAAILKKPNVSLYCLDPTTRQAIFVETPAEIDLSLAPFYYQAQYEFAQRLHAVSYQDFHQLAAQLETRIDSLIVIYSVGRCGSTLLSKIFAKIPSVLSLSEPDVLSQLVALRQPDGSSEAEILHLLTSCIKFICKPTLHKTAFSYVLKPRSFCIELCDLLDQFQPKPKNIFLWRRLEAAVRSSINAFGFMQSVLPSLASKLDLYSRFIPLLRFYVSSIDYMDPQAIDLFIVSWLSGVYRYSQLCKDKILFYEFSYEQLVNSPQQTVTDLFDYCGFDGIDIESACQAMDQDAQKGSRLAKKSLPNQGVDGFEVARIQERINYLLTHYLPELNPRIW